ncbi:MAG: VWA domain-containing protein [Acidobacteriia bacterium]|nr:VWA domain-containing protein [Terriglobia bacterium]
MRTLRRALSGLAILAALPALTAGLWWTGVPARGSDRAHNPSGSGPWQQDRPAIPKSFSLKVNVDLVTIDAIVRDKRGAAVGDLQSTDFLIYDNGVAQEITHFSRDQLPLAVALVIDRSPSISSFLPDLRSAGLSALKRLKPQDQVALYSFDECPTQLTELTEDRDVVAARIGEIRIGRSTNIYGAIFESARFLRENAPDRRRAIILVSDNYSSVFPMTEQDVLTQVLESSVTLFSIRTPGYNSMGSGNPGSINRIAKETGGEVLQLGNSEKLSAALDRAISNLRLGYTLGFVPAKSGEDHSFHKLNVRFNVSKTCPGCRIQARSGYYAGANASLRPGVLIGRTSPPYNCAAYFAEATAKQRLWLAAEAEVDFKQVYLQVTTGTETDARGKSQIKVNLHIGPAGIGFRNIDSRYVGRLDVAVFYGDAKGNYLGEEWQTADLQLQEDEYQQVLKSGVSMSIMIPFKTPGQIFKVAVCDIWSGRVGTRLMRMR